jgi:hypothetical protein
MASPSTSVGKMYADAAAEAAGKAQALTAAAAAKNNSFVATADGRLAALTAAAAAKNNSMVAAAPFNQMMAMIEQRQGRMWVIKDFEKLEGQLVGTGQCPAIVQTHGQVPKAEFWFEGPRVRGRDVIPYGTAVATFVNGRYQNNKHGNHVAIYIKQHPVDGVLVFDQWTHEDPEKRKPAGPRWMPFGDGVTDPSNDGAALSIILTRKTN